MPHLVVRHNNNLKNINFKNYFSKSHKYLAHKLAIKEDGCRSLVLASDEYLVGIDDQDTAFIHIEIMIKAGRDLNLVKEIGNYLVQLLNNEVLSLGSTMKIKTSIELREVDALYFS